MRDQQEIVIDDFKGFWTRDDTPPLGYGSITFLNIQFDNKAAFSREQIDREFALSVIGMVAGDRVHGIWAFRPSSAPSTPRYIVLLQNVALTSGRLFDTGSATPTVAILTIASMTSASVVQLFDRVYISPTGSIAGEFVYVYDPALMATARKIAALAPTTAPAAAIGAAGNCEPGLHLISVAYETNTGFITKPARTAGVSVATQVTVPAATPSIISLTAIPLGPTGTSKRHILMSKVVPQYNGDPEKYRFFIAATIADNTTTILSLSVFDSQLVSSSDYLYKLKEEVENCTSLGVHDGRLLTIGPRDDIYLMRVSNASAPETFQATDGFVIVGKGDGGRLQNAKSFRGNIYAWKGRRTYGVQPNDQAPSSWPVVVIDVGKGTGPNGVASVADAPLGANQEGLIVTALDGMWFFDGAYGSLPLSWVIEDVWASQVNTAFGTHFATVDPISYRIFVMLQPKFATGTGFFYVCDYSDGLTADKVRWSQWSGFADGNTPIAMVVEPVSVSSKETSQLSFCTWDPPSDKIRGILLNRTPGMNDIDSTAATRRINWSLGFGNLRFGNGKSTFIGYRLRASGGVGFQTVGYNFSALGPDNLAVSVSGLFLPSAGSTPSSYARQFLNFVTEWVGDFGFTKNGATVDSTMGIFELVIYGKETWPGAPQ